MLIKHTEKYASNVQSMLGDNTQYFLYLNNQHRKLYHFSKQPTLYSMSSTVNNNDYLFIYYKIER